MSGVSRRYCLRIGSDFPPDEGCRLARELLRQGDDLDGLEVDVRGVPPETLVGSFFFAFLQTIHELAPDRLPAARKIRWLPTHDFQARNVANWARTFRPN